MIRVNMISMDRCRAGIQVLQFVKILILTCAVVVLIVPDSAAAIADVTHFTLSETTTNISSNFVECHGDSSLTTDTELPAMCLTPEGLQNAPVAGRCFYKDPVQFSTNSDASFSTMFSFNTLATPTYVAGEGFTFFLGPDNVSNGSTGGFLGWLANTTATNVSNAANAMNGHNFAVEFDIYQEHKFNDSDSNHVGIDVNSVVSSKPIWLSPHDIFLAHTDSAIKTYVWIDYDGVKKMIDVFIDYKGRKPCRPVLSQSLDLKNIILQEMYAGFTSSTGSAIDDGATTSAQTTIYDWSFSTTLGQAQNIYGLDQSCHEGRISLSWPWIVVVVIASLATVALLAMGCFLFRRSKKIMNLEMNLEKVSEELLLIDYGPKEYSYKELSVATNRFSKQRVIGEGGFGTVYQGVVSSRTYPGDVVVAIKKMHKKSKQSVKEFVAEVKVIGRLRHVNMVPLLGWCVEFGELLLVYENMPNKNLQELLFPVPDTKGGEVAVLSWEMRLKVLRGVAAALVFLHDDCEQRVVHRDIKSSNVMLDDQFNARLGDFGLARLYDKTDPHHSTERVAGTIGYMAPETVVTGNATTKSDVYSFGAMVLEFLTGRRPADWQIPGEQGLVRWVWKLQDEDRVLETVDPLLKEDYDPDVMKKMMKMGLFCCLPDPDARPIMRQVQTVLQSESPILSSELPSLTFLSRHIRMGSETDISLTSFDGSVTDWGSFVQQSSKHLLPSQESSLNRSVSETSTKDSSRFNIGFIPGYTRMQSWS